MGEWLSVQPLKVVDCKFPHFLLHLLIHSLASLVSRLPFMHLLHQDFANQFLARPNKTKPKLFLRFQRGRRSEGNPIPAKHLLYRVT